MKELHLQEYERDLTRLTFLRAIASSAFVVLLFVLVPLFAFDAPHAFMGFLIPSDYLQSLSPSAKAIAAALCAAALFPWIVALARVWRRTIAAYALAIGAILVLAQVLILVDVLEELSVASTRQMILTTVRLVFAAASAAVSYALASYIVKDGWLTSAKQDQLPAVAAEPGWASVGEIMQAALGIDPECSWLPRWWQRLAARFLYLLASIGRGLLIVLLILLFIPFRIKGAATLIPEGIELSPNQLGELAAPFVDIVARAINIGIYRFLLIFPVVMVRAAAHRLTRVSVETLLQEDKRPPVLFLRSFYDDQGHLAWANRGRLREWIAFGEASPALDHLVLYETMRLGPAVAIGRPNTPVPFGIARTYVSDDHWQDEIARLAEAASAIVIVLDDTSGVKWESDYVENHCSAKTLYLIPPRLASPDNAIELLNDRLFKTSPATGDQTSAPDRELSNSCIGWYVNRDGQPILLTSDQATAAAYVVALRLYVIACISGVASPASELEFQQRHKAEKPPIGQIDTVFQTSRGILVLLKDARVLAQVSGEYRAFGTALEYRQLFNDDEPWPATKDGKELASFIQMHADLFSG